MMNEEQKEIGDIKLKKNEELNLFEEGKTISDFEADDL
jgi:hypothetical protein